jgi:hypothetical protein
MPLPMHGKLLSILRELWGVHASAVSIFESSDLGFARCLPSAPDDKTERVRSAPDAEAKDAMNAC